MTLVRFALHHAFSRPRLYERSPRVINSIQRVSSPRITSLRSPLRCRWKHRLRERAPLKAASFFLDERFRIGYEDRRHANCLSTACRSYLSLASLAVEIRFDSVASVCCRELQDYFSDQGSGAEQELLIPAHTCR